MAAAAEVPSPTPIYKPNSGRTFAKCDRCVRCKMPKFADIAYNVFFRRNQTFLALVFITGFAFEIGFNTSADRIWDYVNKGRQWKDIKHRYMEQHDEE